MGGPFPPVRLGNNPLRKTEGAPETHSFTDPRLTERKISDLRCQYPRCRRPPLTGASVLRFLSCTTIRMQRYSIPTSLLCDDTPMAG